MGAVQMGDDLNEARGAVIQLRMSMFDLYSETNSLIKQDFRFVAGRRSSRISLRNMRASLDKINELHQELVDYINQREEQDIE
jgi:uncharacterized protein (UPF0305 family)